MPGFHSREYLPTRELAAVSRFKTLRPTPSTPVFDPPSGPWPTLNKQKLFVSRHYAESETNQFNSGNFVHLAESPILIEFASAVIPTRIGLGKQIRYDLSNRAEYLLFLWFASELRLHAVVNTYECIKRYMISVPG